MAEFSTPVNQPAQHDIPKDESDQSSSTSPPPAYTPRTQITTSSGNTVLSPIQQQIRECLIMGRQYPVTTMLEGEGQEDEEDSIEGMSPICLRINTSVLVSKDNNLLCLSDTPASHANAIAKAVVQAIQENSSGQCGIPMIDEDGRPRPVKIEVDAAITVEGSGNVVGNEAVINRILSNRSLSQKRKADDEEGSTPPSPSKRRAPPGPSNTTSS